MNIFEAYLWFGLCIITAGSVFAILANSKRNLEMVRRAGWRGYWLEAFVLDLGMSVFWMVSLGTAAYALYRAHDFLQKFN